MRPPIPLPAWTGATSGIHRVTYKTTGLLLSGLLPSLFILHARRNLVVVAPRRAFEDKQPRLVGVGPPGFADRSARGGHPPHADALLGSGCRLLKRRKRHHTDK